MLKLYIYGYLNRIQSSRRLERESNRNVELMWLLKRLAPDFKTIADFRKDNLKPIQKVCREFVLICRKLNLFADCFVAIDGSKFKAVNNRHHLIVTHEVTNDCSDRSQLASMAKKSKEILQVDSLTVAADKGYFKSEDIKACDDENITVYLPKPVTSNNQAKGLFGRDDFIYHPDKDVYICPAGETAIYRFQRKESNKILRRYYSSACIKCSIKSKCTTGVYRRISRWEHEKVLDELEARMDCENNMMLIRKSTVEHPFGTIKSWMGATHFQMKTLKKVSTEMSLHILAYNMKRVINILGAKPLMEALQT